MEEEVKGNIEGPVSEIISSASKEMLRNSSEVYR